MQPSLLSTCLWTLPITISNLKVALGPLFYQKSYFINLLELWYVNLCIIWFIASVLCRPWNTQNAKIRAQFCSGGIPTCLTLELDVCQVVLSPGAMEWLRCSVGSLTSDLHSLEVPHLISAPHSPYASWWITPILLCVYMNRPFCPMLSIPLTSHILPPLQYGYSLLHVSVSLNLLGSRSCGQLGRACMPAGQPNVHVGMGWMATSRLNKDWALSAFPSGTDAPLALVFPMWTNGSIKCLGTEWLWALCLSAKSDWNGWIAGQRSKKRWHTDLESWHTDSCTNRLQKSRRNRFLKK